MWWRCNMASYCELWASDDSIGGRFRVQYEGRSVELQKATNFDRTIGGGIDMTQGGILEMHDYVVRVRHTEDVANYGDKDVLEALYRLNNPGGTPSNVLTFTDHYLNESEAWLVGNWKDSVLGIMITGTTAWFVVKLSILLKPS